MVTLDVDVQRVYPPTAELLQRLARATHACDIAENAVQLAAVGDVRAVRPLLGRLGEPRVQADRDLADALCDALVALDVMRPCGGGCFAIRPRHLLAPGVVDAITELGSSVPLRYFIARQV
ncbi:MAG: hypothetical protein QOI08_1965 [Actinomycetota bacterium]|jgi:hypothetical protein|nr:hypothetical protein [Actinomycetota bacterium]